MTQIVPSSISTIEYRSAYTTTRINLGDLIDKRIQETVSDMKSKLSAMACTGCSGNIDPRTLVCTCCGRQYRLVASNDEVVDNDRYDATEVF